VEVLDEEEATGAEAVEDTGAETAEAVVFELVEPVTDVDAAESNVVFIGTKNSLHLQVFATPTPLSTAPL